MLSPHVLGEDNSEFLCMKLLFIYSTLWICIFYETFFYFSFNVLWYTFFIRCWLINNNLCNWKRKLDLSNEWLEVGKVSKITWAMVIRCSPIEMDACIRNAEMQSCTLLSIIETLFWSKYTKYLASLQRNMCL